MVCETCLMIMSREYVVWGEHQPAAGFKIALKFPEKRAHISGRSWSYSLELLSLFKRCPESVIPAGTHCLGVMEQSSRERATAGPAYPAGAGAEGDAKPAGGIQRPTAGGCDLKTKPPSVSFKKLLLALRC